MALKHVTDFLQGNIALTVILITVLAMLIAIGWYVIGKIKGELRESGPDANEFMTNFRESHERGELSQEEFRTIKSMLSEHLQRQLEQQHGQPVKDKGKQA